MNDYTKYISTDASVRFGKPIVTGTRIAVEDVINRLTKGQTINQIIFDFPELNKDQINACLEYKTKNSKP